MAAGSKSTSWKRRFFVLKGSNFFWFESQGAPKPRGFIPLEGAAVTCRTVVNRTGEKPHALYVQLPPEAFDTCSRQQLTVAAISEELQTLWYRALSQAAIPRPELLARLQQEGRLDEVVPSARNTAANAMPANGYHASMSFRASGASAAAAPPTAGAARGLDRRSRTPLLDEQYETGSAASYASEPVHATRHVTTSIAAQRHQPSKSEAYHVAPPRGGGGHSRSRGGHGRGTSPSRGGRVMFAAAEGDRAPLLGGGGDDGSTAGTRSDDIVGDHWDATPRRSPAASHYSAMRSSAQGADGGPNGGAGAGSRRGSGWEKGGRDSRAQRAYEDGDDGGAHYDGSDPRDARPSGAAHGSRRSSVSPGRRSGRSFAAEGGGGARRSAAPDSRYDGGSGGGGEYQRRSERRPSAGPGERSYRPSEAAPPAPRHGDGGGSSVSGSGSLLSAYLEQQAPLAASHHHRASGSTDEVVGDRVPRDRSRVHSSAAGGGKSSVRPSASGSGENGPGGAGHRSTSPNNVRGSVSWAPKHSVHADPRDGGTQLRSHALSVNSSGTSGSDAPSVASGHGASGAAAATSNRASASAAPRGSSRIPQSGSGELSHPDTVSDQSRKTPYDTAIVTQLSGLQHTVASVQAALVDMHQQQQQQQVAQMQQAQLQARITQQLQLQAAAAAAAAAEARTSAMMQGLSPPPPPPPPAPAQRAAAARSYDAYAHGGAATPPPVQGRALSASEMLQPPPASAAATESVVKAAAARDQERSVLVAMQQTLVRMLNEGRPEDADPSLPPPQSDPGGAWHGVHHGSTRGSAMGSSGSGREAWQQQQHQHQQHQQRPSWQPVVEAAAQGYGAALSGVSHDAAAYNAPPPPPSIKVAPPPPAPPPSQPPMPTHVMAPPTPPMPYNAAASSAPPAGQARPPPPPRSGDFHSELMDQIRNQAEFKFRNHVRRDSIAPVAAYHPSSPYYEPTGQVLAAAASMDARDRRQYSSAYGSVYEVPRAVPVMAEGQYPQEVREALARGMEDVRSRYTSASTVSAGAQQESGQASMRPSSVLHWQAQ
ncbi:hypothetical protein GPECTOR_11g196 [Gonium pectorale]|uniref:PH domain-containing protein n=1 Tax=Gonium pectorale TaxID=33097 RepID=A0A150GQX8_GONPE|nr:hypothetical protein GPECTOR_11g196 [Gonium pectorale]|eukprot:KXZ51750.1 hypothetical protein GPECTOR_11g196 [Gonium pectorale]